MRARHGVDVRLVVDGRGTGPLLAPLAGLDELEELVDPGHAEIRVFNPPLNRVAQTVLTLSVIPVAAGTHEKILVVDDEAAIAGGRNIGVEYFTQRAESAHAFADADVLLDGQQAIRVLSHLVRSDEVAEAASPLTADFINVVGQSDRLVMLYGAMDAWMRGTVKKEPYDDAVLALEAAAIAALDRHKLPPRSVRDGVRVELQKLARIKSIYGLVPVPPLPRHEALVRVVTTRSRVESRFAGFDYPWHHEKHPDPTKSLNAGTGTGSSSDPVDDRDTEGDGGDAAGDALIQAIGAARHRILMESPYTLLTPRMFAALQAASVRGVDISILTNSPTSSDNAMAQALFIDTWPELEARIPTLRVFVTSGMQMQHAKRIVVDDQLSFIGSYNLDPLSAHLNSEIIACVWSKDVDAANRGDIEGRIDRGEVVEYRIARDAAGRPVRDDDGHVVVQYGPRNHIPGHLIDALEGMKSWLFASRGLWDFQWVVW